MKLTRLKLYLSILFLPLAISCQSGVSISVNIVGQSELSTSATAEFTAETNDERGVEWRTTGGIITGSGTTITYQAPAEPGQYTLTATSRTEPSQGDSLQISVTLLSEARIEITSDESFLLTSQGDTAQVSATVYNADGSVDQDATITWTSEDPSQVSIAADGTITAETSTGYTYVRASANGLESERVSVAVAQLAPETRVIPGQLVQGADPNNSQVTLARTVETEALNTGDIIVSDAGIMARITNLEQRQNEIVVTLEDVDFDEAFDRVVISGRSEPIEYTMNISPQGLMVTSDDERIGTQRFDFDELECDGDFDIGANLDIQITEGDVDIEYRPELVFNYDSAAPSNEQKLQIFTDWQPGVVTRTPITLAFDVAVEGSASCILEDPIEEVDVVLASFWGIISVKASGDINAGISLDLKVDSPEASITLPDFDLFLFDIEVGAGYSNNNGWELINNFNPGDASLDFSPLHFDIDPDTTLEIAFGALATFDLGLTLTLGTPLFPVTETSIEFLEPSLSIGPAFSITTPFDPADPDYTGLISTIRAQPALDFKLELGRDAARIFERFSVDPSITIASFEPESLDLFKPIFSLGIEEGIGGAGTFGFDTLLGFESNFVLFGRPVSISVNDLAFFSDLFAESQIEYYGFKYENEEAANDGGAPTQVSVLGTSRLDETFVFEPSPADNGFWRFRALILDSDPVGPLPAVPFLLAPPASGLSNPLEVNVVDEGLSLSLGQNAVQASPGDSTTIGINLARTGGFSDEVNLSLQGSAVDNGSISATFAPNPVSAGSTTSTMTLDVSSDAPSGVFSLTVVAESPSGEVSDTASLEVNVTGEEPGESFSVQFGTSEFDAANDLATNGSDSIYVVGNTGGQFLEDTADAFLFKYDNTGNRAWERQFSTSSNDAASAVATDSSGNVYVVGQTRGSLFGSNAGFTDAFLVKYDSAGNQVWERQFGTSGNDQAWDVAIDGNSNIYVVGDTDGSLFGDNAGEFDAYLVKYNSAGDQVWGRQIGTGERDVARGVTTDSNGGIYVVGHTGGDFFADSADAFLIKYDSAGNSVWGQQFSTSTADAAFRVSTDSSGNVYVVGQTRGSLFGSSAGNLDAFLVKYNSAGNQVWEQQFGTFDSDQNFDVATDSSGSVYVTGNTNGSLFGDNAGSFDAFLVKYDSAGNQVWGRQFGTGESDSAFSVATDSSGSVYVTGRTFGSLFGDNAGSADAFLAKYDSAGNQQ